MTKREEILKKTRYEKFPIKNFLRFSTFGITRKFENIPGIWDPPGSPEFEIFRDPELRVFCDFGIFIHGIYAKSQGHGIFIEFFTPYLAVVKIFLKTSDASAGDKMEYFTCHDEFL